MVDDSVYCNPLAPLHPLALCRPPCATHGAASCRNTLTLNAYCFVLLFFVLVPCPSSSARARPPVAPARAHARLPAGATHVSASTICTPSRATRQPRSREPSCVSLQRKALGWGCTGPILLQTLRPQCADTQCLMLYVCMRLGLVQMPWHTHNPVAACCTPSA